MLKLVRGGEEFEGVVTVRYRCPGQFGVGDQVTAS